MFRLLAFALIVAVTTALTKPEIDREWSLYKTMYNKNYSPEVEQKRRDIFEDNLNFIQKHNLAADRGVYSFRVGINEYVDMTNEEFVKAMNGYQMRPQGQRSGNPIYLKPSNIGDLPASVDWRTKGYVTPVKNQGSCGSCWAFSSTGSLEGQTFKKTGKLISLSEQNLVDCSRKQGNMGCEGGLMDQAFTYIKVNHGIDTEQSYPYQGINADCRFKQANVGANDTGFVDIKSGSESDLQNAVATVGPISVAIDAGHLSFQLYKSGVYHSFICSAKKLDHGVLAAGYGTLDGKDYWLVKNSWGASFGMKGYILMSRNKDNNCGIATAASYPTV